MNKFIKYLTITLAIFGIFFIFISIKTIYLEKPKNDDLIISETKNRVGELDLIKTQEMEEVELEIIEEKQDNEPGEKSSESPISIKNPINLEEQLVTHLLDIKSGSSSKGIAFSKDDKELWVTLLMNKSTGIRIFNPKTGEELESINLNGNGGVEVIFSQDGTKAYVSQMETAKIFEIDTNTKEILRILNTNSAWTKVLKLSPDEKMIYASNWVGNNVSEIDLITGILKQNISTVKTPRGIYVTRDGKILYVAGFKDGEIQKINLETEEKQIIYQAGGAMRHIVADEEKNILYISDMGQGKILKVSLENDEIKEFAKTDTNPNTIALSPDNKILFVSNRGANYSRDNYYLPGPEWGSVLLFDTETGKMLDAIIGGNQPTALAISSDGKILAFSNFLDGEIEIYQIPPSEILKTGNGGISKIYKGWIDK